MPDPVEAAAGGTATGTPAGGSGPAGSGPTTTGGTGGSGALTAEQVSSLVGKAVEDRLPRVFAGFLNRVNEIIPKTIDERLAAVVGSRGGSEGAGAGAAEHAGGQPADIERARTNRILKEQSETIAKLEATIRQREEREIDGRKRGAINDAISEAGVTPTLRKALAAQILADGSFKLTEDGVFYLTRRNGMDEAIGIKDYVRAYLGSEEGAAFLPARQASSVRGAGGDGGPPTKMTDADFDPVAMARDPKKLAEAARLVASGLGNLPEARGLAGVYSGG